jgi:Multicopper oxidase
MAEAASPPLTLGPERSLRATEPLADRKADRTHVLNLTGSMQGYQWSINNVAWSKDVPPLMVSDGERVELAITNQTMMPHPMHSKPPKGRARWTLRLLENKVVELNIVDRASDSTIGRTLKKTFSSRI